MPGVFIKPLPDRRKNVAGENMHVGIDDGGKIGRDLSIFFIIK